MHSSSLAGRFDADRLFRLVTGAFAVAVVLLFMALVAVLWHQSGPAREAFGLGFLTSSQWNPVTERFGALIAVVGTLTTTAIAMAVALPVSLGIAVYLTEIAPGWLRGPVGVAIELLAAVPSIVYGMWGLFVVVPLMADHVEPWLQHHLGWLPLFAGPPMGIGVLTAGLVLALMVVPFVSSVTRDVFLMTPPSLKEAAYGLGATPWEVVKDVVLPYGKRGVVGAVFLGLGRALGETMAVTFVIGNAYRLSWSLFAPGNSIASTLANEFTEADGDLHLAALIELGLVLFAITFVVLVVARLWLGTSTRQGAR